MLSVAKVGVVVRLALGYVVKGYREDWVVVKNFCLKEIVLKVS